MSEHKPEKLVPWRVAVAVDDVAEAGENFELVADADVRAATARVAGLIDLPRFEASFELRRHGDGGLHVAGRISATVGQTCVVTLEPLTNEVAEDIDLLFLPQSAAAGEGQQGEVADASLGNAEPLVGGSIDLGAIATEFLILGLDPYPRKPGAVFEPPQNAEPDEGPFAVLAPLKQDDGGR